MFYSKTRKGFYAVDIHGGAIPSDAVEITAEEHAALLAGQATGLSIVANAAGHPVLALPQLTAEQIVATYEQALDDHLDAVARTHRYTDRFTFALRAGYPGPYHDEGAAFAAWMDTCNVQAFALLQSVQSGAAELPTIEDFIAALPEFVL